MTFVFWYLLVGLVVVFVDSVVTPPSRTVREADNLVVGFSAALVVVGWIVLVPLALLGWLVKKLGRR